MSPEIMLVAVLAVAALGAASGQRCALKAVESVVGVSDAITVTTGVGAEYGNHRPVHRDDGEQCEVLGFALSIET